MPGQPNAYRASRQGRVTSRFFFALCPDGTYQTRVVAGCLGFDYDELMAEELDCPYCGRRTEWVKKPRSETGWVLKMHFMPKRPHYTSKHCPMSNQYKMTAKMRRELDES